MLELPDVMLALSVLLALAALLAVVTRGRNVPLSLLLVLVGFVTGEIARSSGIPLPIEGEQFGEVLVFVFLPVLVFEAALALSTRVFLRNLAPILALAIGALAVSAVVVGLAVNAVLGIPLATALLFGVLISATDPVAVVAAFRDLGVPQRLLTLVEGESLLNDGIAIVLFNLLLVVALGTADVTIAGGVGDFAMVFLGGAAIGGVMALGVAEIAARLGTMPSTALTVALAYGSFVLADHVLGVSGVMASVSAGLVLSGLSNTLIPRDEARVWHTVWETAAFTANGILFILIGLALEASLIAEHWPSILVAVLAVIVARPLGVFPLMPAVTRLAGIPRVGYRNQVVLVWGGLRGGVALALALALPESLAHRDELVAMTGGVVLATLLLNATTIRPLVGRLGLADPDAATRFVGALARHMGARRALEGLAVLGNEDADARAHLETVIRDAERQFAELSLSPDEIRDALRGRGLAIELATIQELTDQRLLPQWHARVIISSLEDQIEELSLGRFVPRPAFEATGLRWLVYRIAQRLHGFRGTPQEAVDLALRDAMARRMAADRALMALDAVLPCAGIDEPAMAAARELFEQGRRDAARAVRYLEDEHAERAEIARRAHAADFARAAAAAEVRALADVGLVPLTILDDLAKG